MNISELISFGIKFLKSHSPTPNLDAEILLRKVLSNKSKEYIYTNPDKIISQKQTAAYRKLLTQRKKRVPVAYLTRQKEFYGLEFYVNKSVLIPRPETEMIIGEIVALAQKKIFKKSIVIADIGTGSGCIAVTLAKILNRRLNRVYATDISRSALQIARRNAASHSVAKKINFLQGSLLQPIRNKKVDILVANLPYLPVEKTKEYYRQCPELRHEPKQALFAKEKGSFLYTLLFEQLSKIKHKPKIIFLEVHNKNQILPFARQKFKSPRKQLNTHTKIMKDLGGYERIIKINIS